MNACETAVISCGGQRSADFLDVCHYFDKCNWNLSMLDGEFNAGIGSFSCVLCVRVIAGFGCARQASRGH